MINPTKIDLERTDIDMIIAGSAKDIIMVEVEMSEISEDDMISAIMVAHEAIKNIAQFSKRRHCSIPQYLII